MEAVIIQSVTNGEGLALLTLSLVLMHRWHLWDGDEKLGRLLKRLREKNGVYASWAGSSIKKGER